MFKDKDSHFNVKYELIMTLKRPLIFLYIGPATFAILLFWAFFRGCIFLYYKKVLAHSTDYCKNINFHP